MQISRLIYPLRPQTQSVKPDQSLAPNNQAFFLKRLLESNFCKAIERLIRHPRGQLFLTRSGFLGLARLFNRVSASTNDRLLKNMPADGIATNRYCPTIECNDAPSLASQQSKLASRLVDILALKSLGPLLVLDN